jgi:hypothetical protein
MLFMQQDGELLPDRFPLRKDSLLENPMLDVMRQFAPSRQNCFA